MNTLKKFFITTVLGFAFLITSVPSAQAMVVTADTFAGLGLTQAQIEMIVTIVNNTQNKNMRIRRTIMKSPAVVLS